MTTQHDESLVECQAILLPDLRKRHTLPDIIRYATLLACLAVERQLVSANKSTLSFGENLRPMSGAAYTTRSFEGVNYATDDSTDRQKNTA